MEWPEKLVAQHRREIDMANGPTGRKGGRVEGRMDGGWGERGAGSREQKSDFTV